MYQNLLSGCITASVPRGIPREGHGETAQIRVREESREEDRKRRRAEVKLMSSGRACL